MPSSRNAAAFGVDRRFQDHDDFAASLLGGAFDCTPGPSGAFDARLRILRVGDMLVQQGENGAHALRGAIQADISALIVPLHYAAGPARMNGAEVQATEAFLAPGGVEFSGHNPGRHSWAALAVPTERMNAWLELARPAVRSPGEACVVEIPAKAGAALFRDLSAAACMAECLPPMLSQPGCVEGLARSLAESMIEAMTGGAALRPPGRAVREARRIVRAAEDYLRAEIARPIYREELCAALGVSLRKLHDAFVATVGISPQSYLKVRRLTLVRRALRAEGHRPVLVKSVALAHGFWHLGHFARDYRALFGEPPSATAGRLATGARSAAGMARAA